MLNFSKTLIVTKVLGVNYAEQSRQTSRQVRDWLCYLMLAYVCDLGFTCTLQGN